MTEVRALRMTLMGCWRPKHRTSSDHRTVSRKKKTVATNSEAFLEPGKRLIDPNLCRCARLLPPRPYSIERSHCTWCLSIDAYFCLKRKVAIFSFPFSDQTSTYNLGILSFRGRNKFEQELCWKWFRHTFAISNDRHVGGSFGVSSAFNTIE
jgi:hypothetical protein